MSDILQNFNMALILHRFSRSGSNVIGRSSNASFCERERPHDRGSHGRPPNMVGMGKGWRLEVFNFPWWSGPGYGFRVTFHFSDHCGIGDLANLLAFLIQSPTDFYDVIGEMTHERRQKNESDTFWERSGRHPD